jgi:hypothetical protein
MMLTHAANCTMRMSSHELLPPSPSPEIFPPLQSLGAFFDAFVFSCCGGVRGQRRGAHCNRNIYDCLSRTPEGTFGSNRRIRRATMMGLFFSIQNSVSMLACFESSFDAFEYFACFLLFSTIPRSLICFADLRRHLALKSSFGVPHLVS